MNDKNVRLTTRHYETYLSGLNENGFRFDSDYYLKLIDKEHIQATPRLYTLLLNQFVDDSFQFTQEKNPSFRIDIVEMVKSIVQKISYEY